jgi:chlorite dismutase
MFRRLAGNAEGDAGPQAFVPDLIQEPSQTFEILKIAEASRHDDEIFFAGPFRELLNTGAFGDLLLKPELTMFGRTYASGFETELEDWLLRRPRRTVLNPFWPWGIWYPLRRNGAFARLTPQEQGAVIREHSVLGRAYGEADLAHDVRLACHGLDVHDNDFVIGLCGRELHPLSHLIQAMRKTAQTSQYLQTLGPFFVGHAIWQSPLR